MGTKNKEQLPANSFRSGGEGLRKLKSLSPIFINDLFITDFYRRYLSLVFSNASDNTMRSEAKRNKSVILDHQNLIIL